MSAQQIKVVSGGQELTPGNIDSYTGMGMFVGGNLSMFAFVQLISKGYISCNKWGDTGYLLPSLFAISVGIGMGGFLGNGLGEIIDSYE